MKVDRTLRLLVPVAALGLGISLYLTWIYSAGESPLCLGSGGCGSVQASPYARMGALPVPGLGILFYGAIVALALLAQSWYRRKELLLLSLFGLCLAGAIFSGYLTVVELFVIHAICYWCVASAFIVLLACVLTVLALYQWNRGV